MENEFKWDLESVIDFFEYYDKYRDSRFHLFQYIDDFKTTKQASKLPVRDYKPFDDFNKFVKSLSAEQYKMWEEYCNDYVIEIKDNPAKVKQPIPFTTTLEEIKSCCYIEHAGSGILYLYEEKLKELAKSKLNQ